MLALLVLMAQSQVVFGILDYREAMGLMVVEVLEAEAEAEAVVKHVHFVIMDPVTAVAVAVAVEKVELVEQVVGEEVLLTLYFWCQMVQMEELLIAM